MRSTARDDAGVNVGVKVTAGLLPTTVSVGVVWVGETGMGEEGGVNVNVARAGRFTEPVPELPFCMGVSVGVGGMTSASAASIWINPAPE